VAALLPLRLSPNLVGSVVSSLDLSTPPPPRIACMLKASLFAFAFAAFAAFAAYRVPRDNANLEPIGISWSRPSFLLMHNRLSGRRSWHYTLPGEVVC